MERRNFIIKGMSLVTMAGTFVPFHVSARNSGEKGAMFPGQDKRPEFNDGRSKKIIFLANCILNQNARINKSACSPSSIVPVVNELMKREIGIIQMPCPETEILGLSRGAGREIYDELSDAGPRKSLKKYAGDVFKLVREYQEHYFKVLGILGIDGSPGCGVKLFYHGGEKEGTGAFMEELIPLMAACNPPIPVLGIKDRETDKAISLIEQLDKA